MNAHICSLNAARLSSGTRQLTIRLSRYQIGFGGDAVNELPRRSAALQDDVILLLKDVTGLVEERDTALREREIRQAATIRVRMSNGRDQAYMRVSTIWWKQKHGRPRCTPGIVTRLIAARFKRPCSFLGARLVSVRRTD
ncbi:MAG: hypothetical protein ACLVJ6_07110 [Merdibacter sp.]